MRVWRIARSTYAGSVEDMLSGEGAARYGGRWNPKGMPAVYCSENSSLAALEVLVNLARPSTFPSYRILDLDVPDASIVTAPAPVADARRAGADLLLTHLAMMAPSAVNPLETQRRAQSGAPGLQRGATRHAPAFHLRPQAGGGVTRNDGGFRLM